MDKADKKIRLELTAMRAEWHKKINELHQKPAAVNDSSTTNGELKIGDKAADGTIFAGLTEDGKQQMYAAPQDLPVAMIFNDAAKAVKQLNADKFLGHDDWQIPSVENLIILQKNKDEGALKDTFNTANEQKRLSSHEDDRYCPGWYWSSTKNEDYAFYMDAIRFRGDGLIGDYLWENIDQFFKFRPTPRLSCRPVRLVVCKSP